MSKDETGNNEAKACPATPPTTRSRAGSRCPSRWLSSPSSRSTRWRSADPWSSTWEDTSWHVTGDNGRDVRLPTLFFFFFFFFF